MEAKSVTGHCPHCEHPVECLVKEKDTIVCLECNGPFEIYPDGKIEVSSLFNAVGRVKYVPRDRRVSYYSYPEMRTRYVIKEIFVIGENNV